MKKYEIGAEYWNTVDELVDFYAKVKRKSKTTYDNLYARTAVTHLERLLDDTASCEEEERQPLETSENVINGLLDIIKYARDDLNKLEEHLKESLSNNE